jgi:hypothetical protein
MDGLRSDGGGGSGEEGAGKGGGKGREIRVTLSLSLSITSRPYRRYRISRHSSSSMLPPPSLSQICRPASRCQRAAAGGRVFL